MNLDNLQESTTHQFLTVIASKKWVFCIYACISLVVFGSSVFNEYAYDGEMLIPRFASEISEPSWQVFLQPERYSSETGVMSYRPVGVAQMYYIDARLFNLNAGLSHLINVLIHTLNTYLIFILSGQLLKDKKSIYSFIGALFFLIHPLVSEVVLCTGFRFDLLSLLFLLFSHFVFSKGLSSSRIQKKMIWFISGSLLYFLALMTKEIAVIGLFTIPLFLYLRGMTLKYSLFTLFGLLLLFFLFLLLWIPFQYKDYPSSFLGESGRLLGIANFIISSIEIYLYKLILPWPLRVDYRFEPVATISSFRFLRALIILFIVGVSLILICRVNKAGLFGLVWIPLSFAPVSQIVPVPDPVAERFCYVPMAGLAFVFSYLVYRLSGLKYLSVSLILIFLCWGLLSFKRTFDWRDDVTLNIRNWEDAGDYRPFGLESLGALYLTQVSTNQYDSPDQKNIYLSRAELYLKELLKQEPENSDAYRLLALKEMAAGNLKSARSYGEKAQKLDPDNPLIQQLMAFLNEE